MLEKTKRPKKASAWKNQNGLFEKTKQSGKEDIMAKDVNKRWPANKAEQVLIRTAVEALADEITSNGLKVDIGDSVTLDVDLLTVDVEAITGTSPNNKTLKDLHDQLTGTVSGTLYGSGGGVADLLYSSSGSAGVADLLYSSSAGSGLGDMIYDYLYSNSYGVAYWCEQIYSVLYDVWTNGNNSGDLRVNQ